MANDFLWQIYAWPKGIYGWPEIRQFSLVTLFYNLQITSTYLFICYSWNMTLIFSETWIPFSTEPQIVDIVIEAAVDSTNDEGNPTWEDLHIT